MSDPVRRTPGRSRPFVDMSPAEKLMCEWEARHDVAARGRQVDPAAALQHYLSHSRCEDGLHHPGRRTPRPPQQRRPEDAFAAAHPLTAAWLRWGEEPRGPHPLPVLGV